MKFSYFNDIQAILMIKATTKMSDASDVIECENWKEEQMKIKNNSGKKAQFLVALSILIGCLTIISALPQPSQAQTRTQGKSSREVDCWRSR
jgi:hypothetical protein